MELPLKALWPLPEGQVDHIPNSPQVQQCDEKLWVKFVQEPNISFRRLGRARDPFLVQLPTALRAKQFGVCQKLQRSEQKHRLAQHQPQRPENVLTRQTHLGAIHVPVGSTADCAQCNPGAHSQINKMQLCSQLCWLLAKQTTSEDGIQCAKHYLPSTLPNPWHWYANTRVHVNNR